MMILTTRLLFFAAGLTVSQRLILLHPAHAHRRRNHRQRRYLKDWPMTEHDRRYDGDDHGTRIALLEQKHQLLKDFS